MVTPQTIHNILRDYRALSPSPTQSAGDAGAESRSLTTPAGGQIAGIPPFSPISADDWFNLEKRYAYFRALGMVGTPATPGMAYKPGTRGALNVNDPVHAYRMRGWEA